MPTTESDKVKLVKVELDNVHYINGITYQVGTHEVPSEVAEDLVRADKAYNKYLADLNKNNPVNGNLGSRSAA